MVPCSPHHAHRAHFFAASPFMGRHARQCIMPKIGVLLAPVLAEFHMPLMTAFLVLKNLADVEGVESIKQGASLPTRAAPRARTDTRAPGAETCARCRRNRHTSKQLCRHAPDRGRGESYAPGALNVRAAVPGACRGRSRQREAWARLELLRMCQLPPGTRTTHHAAHQNGQPLGKTPTPSCRSRARQSYGDDPGGGHMACRALVLSG